MRDNSAAKGWMTLVGAVLVLVGLLGFIPNPIVGTENSSLSTDVLHNVVHVGTGALALYIAFGLRGDAQASATLGFGVLYLVIFIAVVLNPTLFGLFQTPANAVLHLIHAALALVSLAVGYMARNSRVAPTA